MSEQTKIQWADHTFNPWRGCTKVATECEHCYADTTSKRNPGTLGVWGPLGTRVVAAEAQWKLPLKWDREAAAAGVRRRVFCASLADVFEQWGGSMLNASGDRLYWSHVNPGPGDWHWIGEPDTAGDEPPVSMEDVRNRLFQLIDQTPHLDWLLLTKRPENVLRMWPLKGDPNLYGVEPYAEFLTGDERNESAYRSNVWIGTSAGTQATADKAIPELLRCRDLCPVLFVSAEPLLEAVDFRHEVQPHHSNPKLKHGPLVDWIIAGGESGHGARPCDIEWIRSIRDQCRAAGVAFFCKQLGANVVGEVRQCCGESWLNGSRPYECSKCGDRAGCGVIRANLTDKKGGDPSEWPEDLRIRELPTTGN